MAEYKSIDITRIATSLRDFQELDKLVMQALPCIRAQQLQRHTNTTHWMQRYGELTPPIVYAMEDGYQCVGNRHVIRYGHQIIDGPFTIECRVIPEPSRQAICEYIHMEVLYLAFIYGIENKRHLLKLIEWFNRYDQSHLYRTRFRDTIYLKIVDINRLLKRFVQLADTEDDKRPDANLYLQGAQPQDPSSSHANSDNGQEDPA